MSGLICAEKIRLMQEYQHTMEIYSAAIKKLAEKMGVVPKSEYERLIAVMQKARQASIDAREQLERHISQHGC